MLFPENIYLQCLLSSSVNLNFVLGTNTSVWAANGILSEDTFGLFHLSYLAVALPKNRKCTKCAQKRCIQIIIQLFMGLLPLISCGLPLTISEIIIFSAENAIFWRTFNFWEIKKYLDLYHLIYFLWIWINLNPVLLIWINSNKFLLI